VFSPLAFLSFGSFGKGGATARENKKQEVGRAAVAGLLAEASCRLRQKACQQRGQ
jgi:hypothetical protein